MSELSTPARAAYEAEYDRLTNLLNDCLTNLLNDCSPHTEYPRFVALRGERAALHTAYLLARGLCDVEASSLTPNS